MIVFFNDYHNEAYRVFSPKDSAAGVHAAACTGRPAISRHAKHA